MRDLLFPSAYADIALRKYVKTLMECGIDTLTEAIKVLPPLSHPVFEHKPPMLNRVEVWRIGRQIP